MGLLFELPDESLLSSSLAKFPCRDSQIRSLAALIYPSAAPCNNIVVHGTEATGKSSITASILKSLACTEEADNTSPSSPSSIYSPVLRYAIVSSAQCITARHLFETIIAAVANALGWDPQPWRCETLSQLVTEVQRLIEIWYRLRSQHLNVNEEEDRFVLVLDEIDRQREAPVTLLPGLARLSEIIPSVTCVFIVTSPSPCFLRIAAAPHVHFPAYTKPEFVKIMTTTSSPPREPPVTGANAAELADLWQRFCTFVHDSLAGPAARTLPALRIGCRDLWPRFTAPIRAGNIGPREFSKLFTSSRMHFQDENLLCPSIIAARSSRDSTLHSNVPGIQISRSAVITTTTTGVTPDLAALLPRTARLVLLAAYLASHNTSKHDLTLFSTYHHGKRKRRGGFVGTPGRSRGGRKHRKIARRLLGAHVFVLERMMAIFASVQSEWVGNESKSDLISGAGLDGDIAMAVATLASLRLLVRVGASGDLMDRGGKWRINVGWDMVRALGRSMGVELEDWLIE